MYFKNLDCDLRLRLSSDDFQFLKDLSEIRDCSISTTIRYILCEYKRKYLEDVHGNTKTNLVNQL